MAHVPVFLGNDMDKAIEETEKYLLHELRKTRTSLRDVVASSCSELARLFCHYVLKKGWQGGCFIMKGERIVFGGAHDLVLLQKKNHCNIVDPTIWQFFPKERSMALGVADSFDDAVLLLRSKYGGRWSISEEVVASYPQEEYEEMWRVVRENGEV